MADPSKDEKDAFVQSVISLANIFSTCVECFGLIHPGKNWDKPQQLLLTRLGIQQAKLLIWGDNLGICALGADRDPRLDEPSFRLAIEMQLQSIIDRPVHTDRNTQFEKYGLKPPKRFTAAYEPALDTVRLESFREKYSHLRQHNWEVRRGMSITATHWSIVDNARFEGFLSLVTSSVASLIDLMGNAGPVERALKLDVRALGYHPIFNKMKAAKDTSKLRLIREAHPEYADIATQALDYIQKEYHDDYEMRFKAYDSLGHSEEDEKAKERAKQLAKEKEKQATAGAQDMLTPPQSPKQRKGSVGNIFSGWRPKSWFKDKSKSRSNSIDETAQRSKSMAVPANGAAEGALTPPISPQRSKSVPHASMDEVAVKQEAVSPMGEPQQPVSTVDTDMGGAQAGAERDDVVNDLSHISTATSVNNMTLEQIKSMVSRHDQWKPPVYD